MHTYVGGGCTGLVQKKSTNGKNIRIKEGQIEKIKIITEGRVVCFFFQFHLYYHPAVKKKENILSKPIDV